MQVERWTSYHRLYGNFSKACLGGWVRRGTQTTSFSGRITWVSDPWAAHGSSMISMSTDRRRSEKIEYNWTPSLPPYLGVWTSFQATHFLQVVRSQALWPWCFLWLGGSQLFAVKIFMKNWVEVKCLSTVRERAAWKRQDSIHLEV